LSFLNWLHHCRTEERLMFRYGGLYARSSSADC
jgi:hypothetical protein